LKKRGIPAGLASSSPGSWVEMAVERFNLSQYFRCVVSADDVGGRGKPSPDVYLEAVRRLGLSSDSCIAIEDSVNGMSAALSAGLYTIGFRNGHNTDADLSDADMIIEGFTEENIEGILSILNGGCEQDACL